MVTIFVLLLVALIPTTHPRWEPFPSPIPVRCLWNVASYTGPRSLTHRDDYVISYLNIIALYIWRLGCFFDSSSSLLGYGRGKLESMLETRMKSLLQSHRYKRWCWLGYRCLSQIYIHSVIWLHILDCFLSSVIALTFALTWGTIQLVRPMIDRYQDDKPQFLNAEMEISFGQILPLLLLLQPIMAVIGLVSGNYPNNFLAR
jgi:hypothetical protein